MNQEIKREKHCLYKGAVEIEYLPDSHIYYLLKDGKELPKKKRLVGSSTIANQLDKSTPMVLWATRLYTKVVKRIMGDGVSFTAADVISMLTIGEVAHKEDKEKAGSIGDYVHAFAEQYSKDKDAKEAYSRTIEELGEPSAEMVKQVQTGCVGLVKWIKEQKLKFISAEKIVYSRKVGFVGRYDAIVEINKKRYLLDWKTAKGVYSSHIYQGSGYFKAHEEENPKNRLDGVMIVSIAKEDILDKEGLLIRKAGSVVAVIRTRADVLRDYVAFKALSVIRGRDSIVNKQLREHK